MDHIIIGGVQHPLFFNMKAIESVMAEFHLDDFTQLGETMSTTNISESLKFARYCAYYGIQSGYKKQRDKEQKFPFIDIDDFADAIESFHEIQPAIAKFTEAVQEFFKPREGTSETVGK
jgi:hypothetical protein